MSLERAGDAARPAARARARRRRGDPLQRADGAVLRRRAPGAAAAGGLPGGRRADRRGRGPARRRGRRRPGDGGDPARLRGDRGPGRRRAGRLLRPQGAQGTRPAALGRGPGRGGHAVPRRRGHGDHRRVDPRARSSGSARRASRSSAGSASSTGSPEAPRRSPPRSSAPFERPGDDRRDLSGSSRPLARTAGRVRFVAIDLASYHGVNGSRPSSTLARGRPALLRSRRGAVRCSPGCSPVLFLAQSKRVSRNARHRVVAARSAPPRSPRRPPDAARHRRPWPFAVHPDGVCSPRPTAGRDRCRAIDSDRPGLRSRRSSSAAAASAGSRVAMAAIMSA